MRTPMLEVWTSGGWHDEVEGWIRASVEAAGHQVTGPLEQVRVRSWSTQLTAPTTAGLLWFKENHPGQAAEAAVVGVLGRVSPEHIVVPLAVEPVRGWLLTPDHGQTLATLDATDEDTWCRVVTEYAHLQRLAAEAKHALLAAGLEPLLPSTVAEHVERRVDEMRRLPPDDAAHVPAELADSVMRALPALRRTAEQLTAAAPALESLEHNDLHHNNVFVPRPDETTLHFFDFGDALWAHPFTSLAVPVASLCDEWKTDATDPRVERVVDAYLEAWSDVAGRAELRDAMRLALTLHPVHRFESWRRLLVGSRVAEHANEADAVRHWLGRVAGTTSD